MIIIFYPMKVVQDVSYKGTQKDCMKEVILLVISLYSSFWVFLFLYLSRTKWRESNKIKKRITEALKFLCEFVS